MRRPKLQKPKLLVEESIISEAPSEVNYLQRSDKKPKVDLHNFFISLKIKGNP